MIHPLKPQHYLLISFSTLLAGILFYGLYNGFIIVQFPGQKQALALKDLGVEKRKYKLFFFHQGTWHYEEQELLYSKNKAKTLSALVAQWLIVLEEEHIIDKKVSLQSLLLDQPGTEAFISFDRNPFPKESSTYKKLLFIEALLKTIRSTGIPLQAVRILVNHKPLQDPHLDFAQSWPLSGYLK